MLAADPPSPGDISSFDFLDSSTKEITRAADRNDFRTVDRLMGEQLSEVMQGLLLEDYETGQTGSVMTRRMMGANPEVNLAAVALQIVRRGKETDAILEQNGWGAISAFSNDVLRKYKERNGADKVQMRAGMSEDEMVQASLQFEPVMVDPNEVATYRQQLAKIDAALRPLGSSVWTDPRTARIAQVIQNSAEMGRPGYLADSEQDLNQQLGGFTKYVGLPVLEGVDAFVEGAAQVGVGARSILHDLGLVSLEGLTQGNAAAVYNGPTSWVQDADGNWYHNGGKVGASEVYAGVWYSLTGELIDQQMAEYADTKARAAMQASGVQGLAVGLGQFMGAMGAFMGTGGPAMKAGSLLTKGLGVAVTGGKAAQSLSRTEKVVKILAERSGAAAALGALEATKSGRIEGYGKAMLHGTVMAVPLMVMGSIGDRMERALRRYKHLPGPVAAGLAGTVEGIGLDLGTWEAGFQFVRDPSDETFANLAQQVMVNAIGNGILRGSGITGAPPVHEFGLPPDVQRERKQERRQQAATGDVAEVATARGAQPETIEKLGQAVATTRSSVGTNPDLAFASEREAQRAEERLNVEEAGLARTESEKQEGRFNVREEIKKLREQPSSPERSKKIIQLLNQSRMDFGKTFAKTVTDVAKLEHEKAIREKKEADELLAGSDVVKALLGDRAASDFREQRRAALEQQGVEMTDLAVEEGRGLTAKPEGEDAEIEAMAKKLGISVEEMRAEMGMEAPAVSEMAVAPKAPMPGEPASLRMKPSLEQEGVAGTKPVRESDVLTDLAGYEGDIVQVPIRKGVGIRGRASTKGILGWFHNVENVMRLANKGFQRVVVGAHEWSHAMDLAVKGTNSIWKQLTPEQTKGFIKAAYPYYPGYDNLPKASQAKESWAEFWARHMLDDPTLKEETGAFHDWAMKWISDPSRAKLLSEMNRRIGLLRQYRDQGAVQRVRQTWVAENDKESLQELQARGIMKDTAPAKAVGAIKSLWRKLVDVGVDDIQKLRRAQQRIVTQEFGPEKMEQVLRDLDIQSNPARMLDVYRMTGAKQAEAFLATGTHDIAGNRTGEALADIFKDIGESRYQDFITYMVARKSIEIQTKGHETQLDRGDYLYTIEKLEDQSFIDGARRIREWSDRLIDYAVEGGLFSEEQAHAIKTSYETYIPFQRVLWGVEQHTPTRGVAERGTGVKSLKGGMEEISDPVNALGDMARNIIVKTQQAMVMKAMVKFGLVNKGMGGFITEVPRTKIPKDHPMMQVADAIRRAEGGNDVTAWQLADTIEQLVKAGELGASITLFGQETFPKGSRPIIAYTPHFSDAEIDAMPSRYAKSKAKSMNDKLVWLEVDPDAYRVLMGLDQPQTVLDKLPEFVMKPIQGATSLVRLGATVLDPAFALRNIVRDVASDYVYTSERNKAWLFSAVGRFAEGAIQQYKDTGDVRLFRALGGGVSTFFSGEVAAGRTAREMLRINRTWVQKLRHGLGTFGDLLSKYSELPLRTRAFSEARAKAQAEGKSELSANLEALEAAKRRTIDFTVGGTVSRAIGRLTPYFMAGINGNYKFFSTLAGKNGDVSQRRAMIRAMTGITVPSVVLWAIFHDEEWYQELPEWRRLNYWNFKLPGVDQPMSIPKPFELGKLFGNVPEMVLDQAMVENPLGVQETVTDLVTSLMPTMPIPAIVKPPLEIYTNKNFFTGREMVPPWLEKSRLPKDQRTAYTRWYGEVGAGLARAFGLDPSPIVMEHLVNAYTGGMVGKLSDSITSVGGLKTMLEGRGMRDIPVVSTFFRQGDFEQSRSVQQIFDLDAEFTQIAGSKELTSSEKRDRRIVGSAKDEIAKLKSSAHDGTMPRAEADRRAAEVARQTLKRINR